MKIAVASDLHLEFGLIELKNTENADVLVLAGDIVIADDFDRNIPDDPNQILGSRQFSAVKYRKFIEQVSLEFPHVVVIAGNHEFYHGKWYKTLKILADEYGKYENVHFLENSRWTYNDVTFIGATLWTNLNNGDPLTMQMIKSDMNDYHYIVNDREEYTKLKPRHTVGRHHISIRYFESVIEDNPDQKFFIVSHHAPTFTSVHPYYKDDHTMNGAYCSDLSEFILDYPQIKVWAHGHIHHPWDYMVGETRIVCNPRGYMGHEKLADNFQLKYVEV